MPTIRETAAKVCDKFHPVTVAFKQLELFDASLADIPAGASCYACGDSTSRALIDYSYDYKVSQGNRITIGKALPGYRCDTCQLEYRDPGLSDRFLTTLASALASAGDTRLHEALQRRKTDPAASPGVAPNMPGLR